jgi:hypothetical protein
MKISYAQVFQAAPSLTTLSTRPFSAAMAIKLVDIIEILNPHLIAIERFRDSLQAQAEQKTAEELQEQFAEYLNTTTADLGSCMPIFPEEADAAGLAFTVREMASIRFCFGAPLNARAPKRD